MGTAVDMFDTASKCRRRYAHTCLNVIVRRVLMNSGISVDRQYTHLHIIDVNEQLTVGEPALATSLWGILYAEDAGAVSQSPEQLRKMMEVIVVVCAAFGLPVLEAKTEIMCLRTKGMPESTVILSAEAAGQVYNQTNEFVHLGGNVNHNPDMSIEVDRRIRNAWCSFGKYTLELYDRPSAPLELKIRMLRAEVLEAILHGCVT